MSYSDEHMQSVVLEYHLSPELDQQVELVHM